MCNGDWEHTYGITIETTDNPGWMLTIEVRDTPLLDKPFSTLAEKRSETDWIHCTVKDGIFRASGDSSKLATLIRTFLDWAE